MKNLKTFLTILPITLFSISAEGQWNYSEKIDPITDIEMQSVNARNGSGWFSVVCQVDNGKNYNDLTIQTNFGRNKYLGDDLWKEVIYRVDSEKPTVFDNWMLMNGTLILSAPEKTKKMLDDMKTGEEIVLRVTGYMNENHTKNYSLRGISEKLPRMNCLE